MTRPLVSVVLPCHDAARHLPEALDSLQAQSYEPLEILALDDGSTDDTRALLEAAAREDARIRVLVQETNRGLIPTLNRGVGAARGPFLARMDADDVAAPDRIERQMAALRLHPETGLVGTGVRLLSEDGRAGPVVPPRATVPAACRFLSLLASPVVHPSVLGRTEIFRSHPYRLDEDVLHAEDYELFARMVRAGVRIRNLPDPLLHLRRSDASISRRFEEVQVRNFRTQARAHLRAVRGEAVGEAAHGVLVNRPSAGVGAAEVREALAVLGSLEERAVREASAPARQEIRAVAAEQRIDILVQLLVRGRGGARVRLLPALGPAAAALTSASGLSYLARKLRPWTPGRR